MPEAIARVQHLCALPATDISQITRRDIERLYIISISQSQDEVNESPAAPPVCAQQAVQRTTSKILLLCAVAAAAAAAALSH